MATIDLVQDSTAPQLEFTLTRKDGVVFDLTNVQLVELRIKDLQTGLITNDGHSECAIDSIPNAQVFYGIQAGDLPSGGSYLCDIVVTYINGSVEYNPDFLQIHARGRVS